MPGKDAVSVVKQPGDNVVPAASQKTFPFALKKVMDIPPPNILEEGEDGKSIFLNLGNQRSLLRQFLSWSRAATLQKD